MSNFRYVDKFGVALPEGVIDLGFSEAKPEVSFTVVKAVGYWVLYPGPGSSFKIEVYHRPTDLQIENTKLLLGWGWEDAK